MQDIITGAYYRINTGIYRSVCANMKAKDKYISKNYPFSIGAVDDTGKNRWIYFLTADDAQRFIDKYYKYLNSQAAGYYINNPTPSKTRKILTLVRIDNDGDIPVYCPEAYVKNYKPDLNVQISKPKLSSNSELLPYQISKEELEKEASQIESKISNRYSELTGFRCVGGYFGIDKSNTISIRFEQYLDYGISVLNFNGSYKIKRVPRLCDITEDFIEDFVRNTMIPSLIGNLQRCFFSAHSYSKNHALYQAKTSGTSAENFFTNSRYAIDEALHTSHYKDKDLATKFLKDCLKTGKLIDERYKYLRNDADIIAEALKKRYVSKISDSEIKEFQAAFRNWNSRIGSGLTSDIDFWDTLKYLVSYPKISNLLARLEARI